MSGHCCGHGHAGHGAKAGHHHHHHHHVPLDEGLSRFVWGAGLNIAIVVLQIVAGVLSNSVALLSDAVHNLSDVLGLVAAWAASSLSQRRPSARRTYGLRRSTILAALANGALVIAASGALLWESFERVLSPQPIEGGIVIACAAAGLLINGGTALMFARGRERDLNVRGVFVHMLFDAAVSAGVIVTAVLVMLTGWNWLDPVVSILVVVLIMKSTWQLLKEALDLALDAVPANIDPAAVRAYLTGLPGVTEVHDLHIWAMSTTETALTVHLRREVHAVDDAFLHDLADEMRSRFSIGHTTVQVETSDISNDCRLASDDVV